MTETPRLAPLTAAERTDEQREIIERIGSEFHIFTTFARNADLTRAYVRFAGRLLYQSELPVRVRERLILRTSYRCRCVYEWGHHVAVAREVGMPEDEILALGVERPAGLDPLTELLIAAADQLCTGVDMDDDTWAGLRGYFNQAQMIELCMLVGNYVMTAGVLKAARVQLEDDFDLPAWVS